MPTHAESELQLLHEVFFNASPSPMVLCEEDGNVLGINPAAEALFGVTIEDVTGTHVGRMLPQFPGTCLYGVTQRGAFTCRVVESLVQILHRTARLMVVYNERAGQRESSPHPTDNSLRQRERTANKTALIRGLTKEVGAALNAIEAHLSQSADDVDAACKRARSALHTILEVCSLDTEEPTPMRKDPLDFEELMVQAMENAGALATQNGVLLMYRVDASVPTVCLGDRKKLGKALGAVVQHAMHRTERGYVTLEAKALRIDAKATANADNASSVEILVRDTSVGATAAEVASWLRLPRYDDMQLTKDGIALVAAQYTLERQEGSLEIHSEVNIGTTYRLRFVTQFLAHQAQQEMPWRGLQPALKGKPVIVVDPHVATSAMLRDTMRDWGAKPSVANTIAQAVALTIAQPGCPVVTSMTGKPLAELIERITHKAGHIVVLANGDPVAWQLIIDEALAKGCRIAPVAPPFLLSDLLRQLCHPTLAQGNPKTQPSKAPQTGDGHALLAAMDQATIPESRVHRELTAAATAPTENAPAANGRAATKKNSISPPVMTPSLRILAAIVDPERRNRLVQELARYGYRADVASPGRAAIRAAESRHFDVLVMDDVGGREALDTVAALSKYPQLIIVGLTTVEGSLVPRPGITEFWMYPPNADWGRRLDQLANRRGGMAVGTNTPGVGTKPKLKARPAPPAASPTKPVGNESTPAAKPQGQTWRSVSTTRPHQQEPDMPLPKMANVPSRESTRDDDILARLANMVDERGVIDTMEFTAMNMAELHALVVEMRVAKPAWRNRLACHVLAIAANLGAEALRRLAEKFVATNDPQDATAWEFLLQEIDEVCSLLERHVRSFRHQYGADVGA